ncbi:hypothetical protein ACJMK2_010634 [Sinanodonta woodiana]|uniref:Transient receptor ion channel domain-containing protein n=1 Tax=Sinanodonta woodiana TaxID=1069815 RepID=A0ABD3VJ31_SINWO
MPKGKKTSPWLSFPKEDSGSHKTLSPLQERFIFAAEQGNIPTVQTILEENPLFNVDFYDILGRTPLRLAIENDHLEVVELLIERHTVDKIHEALLLAISSDHEQIALCILRHRRYCDIRKESKRFGKTDYFFTRASEDSQFSSEITPLILASERNQVQIVQLLLLQGEVIVKPHHYYCGCQECSNKLEFDQLRLSKSRLDSYRGLASPIYISLSSTDPILTAFDLAQELLEVSKVEKYFKSEYLSLVNQLREYVVKLLDMVRGQDELKVIIDKANRDSKNETYERLARLKLAIRYNEKKFVVHPSCQQYLLRVWFGHLRKLERSNLLTKSLTVLAVLILYPFMCVIYLFAPKSKVGRFLSVPCIKFIGHTLSFFSFLTIIFASSILEMASSNINISELDPIGAHYRNFQLNSSHLRFQFPSDFKLRAFELQPINILLTLWILGMLWLEVKQLYSEGIYEYFNTLFNYLDLTVLTLYITSFAVRYVGYLKARQSLTYFNTWSNWEFLMNESEDAEEKFYWLIADRFYWEQLDPHNVAEGLFAIGNVISFTRLFHLFAANELLGPLQISLARMTADITKFIVVFFVVLVAFMVGLHNLYWYYPLGERGPTTFLPNNATTEAEKNFGIWVVSFRTVFWSLFGRGEYNVVELGIFNNDFTETVGYLIYGVYNIVTVIVLLNMLIAMMTRSFELIQEEADTEWKFARSKLCMEYIKEGSTLPIPFNIIPTPKTICKLLKRICLMFRINRQDSHTPKIIDRTKDMETYSFNPVTQGGSSSQNESRGNSNLKMLQRNGSEYVPDTFQTAPFNRNHPDTYPSMYVEALTYESVIKRIVRRYIFDLQREDDRNDDVDTIKQDLTSFRYEILNCLSQRTNNEKDDKATANDGAPDGHINVMFEGESENPLKKHPELTRTQNEQWVASEHL